jgi:glycosyltransferase involved in cell wall biosynthesis
MLGEVARNTDRFIFLIGRDDGLSEIPDVDDLDFVLASFGRGGRVANLWRANRIASRLIKNERINVVHDTFGNLLPLMYMKRRFPDVSFCTSLFNLVGWRARHVWGDMPLHRLLRSRGGALMFANHWVEHRTVNRADHVIVQAPGLIPRLREYADVPDERLEVITNNVDTEFWHPQADRIAYGKDHSELRLLYIGGIGPSRGGPAMLDMMARLVGDGINVKLTIIGGWERYAEEMIRERVQELNIGDRVSFPGRVTREGVRDAFHENDLFVYQTINDGSPRIVLEAMASGIPILASHHPGTDVLDPDQEIINFTDYSDVPQMVESVTNFVNDPSTRWKRADHGREVAVEKFSPGAVAQQYIDLYERVLVEA